MKWFTEFYTFRKGERKAIMIICVLLAIVFSINLMVDHLFVFHKETDMELFRERLAVLNTSGKVDEPFEVEVSPFEKELEAPLFAFDPNTLSEEGFRQLGLPAFIAQRIIRYRERGGAFRHKEDLKKIYGLREDDYSRLEAYISIPEVVVVKSTSQTQESNSVAAPIVKIKVDLNLADSIELMKVRGIGPAFAGRIIRYRERLGGFHDISQLNEVFGIDSNMYASIVPQLNFSEVETRKLNINNAIPDDLASHPYISHRLARAIVNFRNANGPYSSSEDLLNIYFINDSIYNRIKPYVEIN